LQPFLLAYKLSSLFYVLKLGKASDPEHLSAEHLVNTHPILVINFLYLCRIMLLTGLVPDSFGWGIVIPLLKGKTCDINSLDNYGGITNKTCDINSLDNYRGITLIPVVAKLFEGVGLLLDICRDFW
jgi:hypothetical protein